MSALAEALLHAVSGDMSEMKAAEKLLKQYEAQNFPAYLRGLCEQMLNKKLPLNARILAGIQLKNTIVARNEQRKHELEKRWLLLQPQVQSQIKMQLLHSLNVPEAKLRQNAALVVAKVAAIEIPRNMWSGLVPQLVHVISEKKTNDMLKEACFTTLGYVCEECPEHLQGHSNRILNAIATGMAKEQENVSIKLEATKALANSLKMVKNNFNVPKERALIMKMVFASAQSNDAKVRQAAYECLVEVARSYYKYIKGFMENIYGLTSNAIKNENEDVAKQAIEFWSTISEEEIEIQEEASELEEKGAQGARENFNLMSTASKNITELLLRCLTKQLDDPDDDTWNVASSAACCLQLMAQNIGDEVVPLVLPFIQNGIRDKNWRLREAATMAFSCILDGPTKQKLVGLVQQAFGVILSHMNDQQPQVKDTAAWTVGKICEELPETIGPDILPNLMNALRKGLSESPKIAVHVCWAIHNLANEVKVMGETSALSKYFPGMVEELLKTTLRGDADQNLQHDAFEAMNVMIHNAAPDTYPIIARLVPELLGRLNKTLQIKPQSVSHAEASRISNAQAQLCGALGYAIVKNPKDSQQYMNPMMEMMIGVLNSPASEAHEEALIAISAVTRCTGQNFSNYMGVLRPFLMQHLRETQSYKICGIATGLVGDICRALEIKIAPFCNEIVEELMRNLKNQELDRSVKPRILNALGDIALAIGGHFDRYLQWVMKLLEDAASFDYSQEDRDYDTIDYLNSLRESILEAYVSILQGLHDDDKEHLFFRYLDKLVAFIHRIANDSDMEPMVIRASCSMIGDLARLLGTKHTRVREFLVNNAAFKKIIHDGLNGDEDARAQASYAAQELQNLQA